MTLQEYTAILIARRKTVIYTGICVMVLGALAFLIISPRYKATASVVANLQSSDPIDATAYPGSLLTTYQATQIAIIKSDRVENLVAQRMHLENHPDMVKQWKSSLYYRPDNFLAWAVLWLDKHLTAKPVRASDVIEISFTNIDPQFAVDLSNAFAQAYLSVALQLNVEPAKTAAQWLRDLSSTLRANLADSQKKLSDFQRVHGIVASDNRLDVESTSLVQLQQQLVTAQGQYADSFSRDAQKGHAGENLPEVLSNPLINSMKSDIAQGEAQLDDMRIRLGVNNPQYISLDSRMKSLRNREDTEIKRVVGSLSAVNNVSVGREEELRKAIAAQKARVLQLRDEHDQATVLENDVEAAQKAFDLGTERLMQATLKGKLQQTNVAILSPAMLPYKPEWPTIPITFLVSVFLSGISGVALALFRESMDPRVHNVSHVAALGNVPAFAIRIPHGVARSARRARLSPSRAWLMNARSAGLKLLRVRNDGQGARSDRIK
jgi:succinoglycan biosynthesis transport protein ExoP